MRAARRILAIWGGLATAMFGIAAYLTAVIVREDTGPYDLINADFQDIGIFASQEANSGLSARVLYQYNERTTSSTIGLRSQASSAKIILNHVADPNACVDENDLMPNGRPKPVLLIPIKSNTDYGGSSRGTYLIDWTAAGRQPFPMAITCSLTAIVKQETYTDRLIYFSNLESQKAYSNIGSLQFGPPLSKWTLDVSEMGGTNNIRFLGGLNPGQSWSSRDLIPDNSRVGLAWESVQADSKRDIIIVVIGALIALGAATALEALRPFVDRIVS
jgi:hypothetical protein